MAQEKKEDCDHGGSWLSNMLNPSWLFGSSNKKKEDDGK